MASSNNNNNSNNNSIRVRFALVPLHQHCQLPPQTSSSLGDYGWLQKYFSSITFLFCCSLLVLLLFLLLTTTVKREILLELTVGQLPQSTTHKLCIKTKFVCVLQKIRKLRLATQQSLQMLPV
ncbi:unnamed protein product [Polarella glacialis]|uniref:Uncharacterized protein n=1 Tax=Polarella glacialis TaxID=89957 RepID=A0A813HMI3_POLGL|nr:unnamed protein product [Polarella glacialis]